MAWNQGRSTGLKKSYLTIWALVIVQLVSPPTASAETTIDVYSKDRHIELDLQKEFKTTRSLEALEPNFQANGKQKYTGVRFHDFSNLVSKKLDSQPKAVTFLCKNQYLFNQHISALVKFEALLAFFIDGKAIPERFGGPLTLVYPTPRTLSEYPWYVRTIVLDQITNPKLYVKSSISTMPFTISTLRTFAAVKGNSVLPLPRGLRVNNPSAVQKLAYTATEMNELLSKLKQTGKKVQLVDLTDTALDLVSVDTIKDLLIVYEINGKPIPVEIGGPYFAMAKPDTKNVQSAALTFFHLKEIKLR